MANPRRNWYSPNNQIPETHLHQSSSSSSSSYCYNSISSLKYLLKKPQAVPLLLSIFLLLTWVSLRLQQSTAHFSIPKHGGEDDDDDVDEKANLLRFSAVGDSPSPILKDKRGWLLNPIATALNSPIKGGAVSCASVHLGEIRPGGVRGNHRHHDCNETFVIWGAKTKFRLENREVIGKGYAEVIIGADEVAVAASPSGTAHALVNMDPFRSTFFIGCQDSVINYNSSTSDFNLMIPISGH